MIVLAAIFALIGAALGSKFKVFLLAPASVVVAASVLLMDLGKFSHAHEALSMFVSIAALQGGYLVAIALRRGLLKEQRAVERTRFGLLVLPDDAKDRLNAR